MIEANSPIDISKDLLKAYKKNVEDIVESFSYQNKPRALHDLIAATDKEERFVMGDTERMAYLGIREGMQVFQAISKLVSDKIDLNKAIVKGYDAVAEKLRTFAHSFAAYAASTFIIHRMDDAIAKASSDNKAIPQGDTTLEGLMFDFNRPTEGTMKEILAPVYAALVENFEGVKDAEFSYEGEFPQVVKQIFTHVRKKTLEKKDQYPDLLPNVQGYNWRILDDIVIDGFEDKTIAKASVVMPTSSFQPICASEIVGNQSAKRKLTRYIERLCLYNDQKQLNPLLELGGLSWTNLFDGPPGTGKSSLFRLAMTILKERAESLGLPYQIFTVDQSIKDEFYGKTGKILLSRLEVTNNPALLSLGIFDDIDLLSSARDEAQGADNDINNILMQYFDGVFTVRRGNVINFAASNKPTGLDDAMRNRFNDRLLIDGPVTEHDFADFMMLKLGKMVKRGTLKMEAGYTPYATQDQIDTNGKWTGGKVAEYMADLFGKRYKSASMFDFGKYLAKLKSKNKSITGRSANAIAEAIKERSADFDVPKEWFQGRAPFLDKTWERQLEMIGELYVPITADVLFQEAKRYFDSEERYRASDEADAIQRGYNNILWERQAQLRYLTDVMARGEGGATEMSQISMLENAIEIQLTRGRKAMADIMARIDENVASKENLIATKSAVEQAIKKRKEALIQINDE